MNTFFSGILAKIQIILELKSFINFFKNSLELKTLLIVKICYKLIKRCLHQLILSIDLRIILSM